MKNNSGFHLKERLNIKPTKLINNPARIFLVAIVSIFLSEIIIVFISMIFSPLSLVKEAFLDASLLTLILLPVLYYLVYKPFRLQLTESKKIEERLLEIEEQERRRIGYDLHDDLGQILTGVSFKSHALQSKLKEEQHPKTKDAKEITFLIEQTIEKTKNLSRGLSPVGKDSEGLVAALDKLASYPQKTFNISCVFKCNKHISIYNKKAIIPLYRIAQEAVTNAIKHSCPNRIEICLKKDNDKITLTVKDDGTGISKIHKQTNGMGLQIMKYRANMMGAMLDIQSENNKGTSIVCTLSDNANEKSNI